MSESTYSTSVLPVSVWGSGCALLAIAVVGMAGYALFSGERLAQKALANGQRVLITLAGEKVEGGFKPKAPVSAPHTPASNTITPPTSQANPPVTAPRPATPVEPDVSVAQQQREASKPSPVARGTESLALAPNPVLVETVGDLSLPIIAADGTAPWKYYGKSVLFDAKKPHVSIVITGLGQMRSMTETAIALPNRFTLSFSPYAPYTPLWVINARNLGFESWADIPFQPTDYPASDPGPYALLADQPAEENTKRMHWSLSRFQGFSGVIAPSGDALTPLSGFLNPFLEELNRRGIGFVYVGSEQNAALREEATRRGQLVLTADVMLDETLTPQGVNAAIRTLVVQAKKEGRAIGVTKAYPVTLAALTHIADTLKAEGVELVPLTAQLSSRAKQ